MVHQVVVPLLKQEGKILGRYKITRLMEEADSGTKQPNKRHRYKIADKLSTEDDRKVFFIIRIKAATIRVMNFKSWWSVMVSNQV